MKKVLNICGEVRDLECQHTDDGYIESKYPNSTKLCPFFRYEKAGRPKFMVAQSATCVL